MKNRLVGITSGLMLAIALAAMAASPSRPYSPPPRASVSRPSASGLYNKPSVAPKPPSSGGYFKPQPKVTQQSANAAAPSRPAVTQAPITRPRYTPSTGASPASSGGNQKPQVQGLTSSGGYQKPGSTAGKTPISPSTSAPTASAKGNRFDQGLSRKLQQEKSQAALTAVTAEKQKFTIPPAKVTPQEIKSNPVVTTTHVYNHIGYDDVVRRRTVVFHNWNPPVYVYHSAPSYGSWSSTFLWWSLMNDSSFYYHHRYDPAVTQWHNDAVRLAEQNGELKAELAKLDSKVGDMERGNVPRNEKYLPQQVAADPVVALSSDAVDSIPVEKPTLRLATGVAGGTYSQVGKLLRGKSQDVSIELVPTSGAEENMRLLKAGKVDAAIVQSDTHLLEGENSASLPDAPTFHRATLYCEYVMVLVAQDSPIKSIRDLGKDSTVYVGPDGSGTSVTWDSFVKHDPQYRGVKSLHSDFSSALEKVSADKNKALLFVAGANTPLLNEAARAGRYRVVPVDDSDLSAITDGEGHAVYDILSLASGTYPGLQSAELKTLGVDAEWTISDAWIKKVGDGAFDKVNYAVIDIVGDLHKPQGMPQQQSSTTALRTQSHWLRNLLLLGAIGFGLWFFIFKYNIVKGEV